ncbi:MAG: hypothetical protein ACYS99_21370, partial [Planctomycetota bacterium]
MPGLALKTGLAVTAALLLLAAAPALGQTFGADHPVRIEVEVRPEEAEPGDTVTVRVTATIDPEYHIYGMPPVPDLVYPTKLLVTAPPGFRTEGESRGPKPEVHVDETLGGVEVP